jgi:hypothetical protein
MQYGRTPIPCKIYLQGQHHPSEIADIARVLKNNTDCMIGTAHTETNVSTSWYELMEKSVNFFSRLTCCKVKGALPKGTKPA